MNQTHLHVVDIDLLDAHPENTLFFRDLTDRELEDLAKNIAEIGMKEPIVITPPDADGRYTICAGHQRVRAFKALGHTEIPAIIDDSLTSPEDIKKALLSTNLFTRSLSPQEIVRIIEALTELKMSKNEIASRLGKSRNTVDAYQKLGTLPPRLQKIALNWPRDLILAVANLEPQPQEALLEMLDQKDPTNEIQQLQKKLDDMREELRTTVIARTAAESEYRLVEGVLKKKEAKIAELQELIEGMGNIEEPDSDQVEEYEEQLRELREELQAKTADHQRAQELENLSLSKIRDLEAALAAKEAAIVEQSAKLAQQQLTENIEAIKKELNAANEAKTRSYQEQIESMQAKLELKSSPPQPTSQIEPLDNFDHILLEEMAAMAGLMELVYGQALSINVKLEGRLNVPTGTVHEIHLKTWKGILDTLKQLDAIISQLDARKTRNMTTSATRG